MTGTEIFARAATADRESFAGATAGEQVLNWFERYVAEHQLDIEDPLPPEDVIVRETGMSRTSVREALTRLRAFGLVESRRKRGMRLKRDPGLIDLVRLLGGSEPASPQLLGEISLLCDALELGLELEIFQHATPARLAALRAAYHELANARLSATHWLARDQHFHEILIGIADNDLATWLLQLFQPFLVLPDGPPPAVTEATLERHRRILAALESRDPVSFHLALREHYVCRPVTAPPAALVALTHAADNGSRDGHPACEAC